MTGSDPTPPHRVSDNPYAAPQAAIAQADAGSDPDEFESVRRAHLRYEASMNALGVFHWLIAIVSGAMTAGLGFAVVTGRFPEEYRWAIYGGLAAYVALTWLNTALGIGLVRLRPWARWAEVGLIGLGIAGTSITGMGMAVLFRNGPMAACCVIALLIQGYLLRLLSSQEGSLVFSTRYHAIVEKTPHLKWKASFILKFLSGLLVILTLLTLLAGLIRAL